MKHEDAEARRIIDNVVSGLYSSTTSNRQQILKPVPTIKF